jgi:carbonic anhydrase
MSDDPNSLKRLFENNKRWREGKKLLDPDYFEKMAQRQTPQYLWIGCSDSRVPAEEVTGLKPGEMFVHRNVANLVVCNDINMLSVIQFAVEYLRVKDIIICGHYGCGGVRAAMENKQLGLLDNWLRNLRDVCRLHHPELKQIKDEQDRLDRLVELNIKEQCMNVFKINLIQRMQLKYGFPRIHGLVYSLRSGELKELDIDYQGYIQQYSSIYRLHSFPSDEIPRKRWQLQTNMLRHLIENHEEERNRISVKYIERVMAKESELFTPEETAAAVAKAKEQEIDPLSPFVNSDAILAYFHKAAAVSTSEIHCDCETDAEMNNMDSD